MRFNEAKYYQFFDYMKIFNAVVIFLLYVDVALNLIDDFDAYIQKGWSMADLFLTVLVRFLVDGLGETQNNRTLAIILVNNSRVIT